MHRQERKPLLYRFFSGLAEHAFQVRLGIADPPLVDYIAEMLVRFVHFDSVYKIRNLSGRRLEEVGEMLLEAEARVGDARRQVHQHIGDYTLFWTGVYPEALRRLRSASRIDWFIDYCEHGKRSYFIASTLRDDTNADECEILARLSRQFEICAYGLGQIRREWEQAELADAAARRLLIE
jgi:hypothetical protein